MWRMLSWRLVPAACLAAQRGQPGVATPWVWVVRAKSGLDCPARAANTAQVFLPHHGGAQCVPTHLRGSAWWAGQPSPNKVAHHSHFFRVNSKLSCLQIVRVQRMCYFIIFLEPSCQSLSLQHRSTRNTEKATIRKTKVLQARTKKTQTTTLHFNSLQRIVQALISSRVTFFLLSLEVVAKQTHDSYSFFFFSLHFLVGCLTWKRLIQMI